MDLITIESILKTFDLTLLDGAMVVLVVPCFIVFWKVMERYVFLPYLHLLEAREAATTGAQAEAQQESERARSFLDEYEEKLTETRIEAMKSKLSLLQSAKSEASKIIDQAEGEARKHVQNARHEAAQHIAQLKSAATREAEMLSQLIADKIRGAASPGIRNGRGELLQ